MHEAAADPWRRRATLALGLAPVVLGLGLALGGPPPAPDLAGRAAEAVEVERVHGWLSALQERFPARVPGTPSHRGGVAFVASALAAAGAVDVQLERVEGGRVVSLHPPSELDAAWSRAARVNVLARVAGRDPGRVVVLAAHHDVVRGAPGAIDDGGAVAALVEVARVLARLDPPPACDVALRVFDGEEEGLVGSKAHVARLGPEERERVVAAVAAELVGWRRDDLVVHTLPYGFAWDAAGAPPPWLPGAIRAAGRRAGVAVGLGDPRVSPFYQATVRLLSLRTGSDAGAYLEGGVPAVMLTGSSLFNFYEGYHTRRDALDLVDAERLGAATRVLAATAVTLAALGEADPPRALGRPALTLGRRTLGWGWLVALGAAAALPLLLAARSLLAAGRRRTALAAAGYAAALVAAAAVGSVAGVLVGVPLGLALAAGAAAPVGRRVALFVGLLPLVVEGLLLGLGAATFGFAWRAGAVETALLLLLAGGGAGLAMVLSRLPAERRPLQTDTSA